MALAEAGVAETGPGAPARARALAWDRAAWTYAVTGRHVESDRALGQARDALGGYTVGQEDPGYLYWVTAEELQIMEARCYTELGHPLRAVPRLIEVLASYNVTHAREMALYLSWLAVAFADANEPEAAAHTARRMIHLAEDLPSDRAASRIHAVTARLRPFATLPDVAEVLCCDVPRGFPFPRA